MKAITRVWNIIFKTHRTSACFFCSELQCLPDHSWHFSKLRNALCHSAVDLVFLNYRPCLIKRQQSADRSSRKVVVALREILQNVYLQSNYKVLLRRRQRLWRWRNITDHLSPLLSNLDPALMTGSSTHSTCHISSMSELISPQNSCLCIVFW